MANNALWGQGSGQLLDSTSMGNSFQALAATLGAVLGNGPIGSGLTVGGASGNTAALSTGFALCGTVCQLATAATLTFAAGTWDVWACSPVFAYSGTAPVPGTYPASTGIAALVPTVVAHGATPSAAGCILATVVSTGTAITSINNSPTGRNSLPGPSPAGTTVVRPQEANFTAQPTGSDAAFTLVNTPNPSRIDLYKNGVLIDPTLYSLSGATVTFGTEPLSTDKISAGYSY